MATIFPGALWRPMPGQEKRPARRKGRGVGFHVAATMARSLYDINLSTGNDAHLYVLQDGSVEQNVDLDLQAWAGVDGNPSMIWVETQGGANPATVNTEPWTPPQAATLARIARWAHDTEGTPLVVMPDSKPASRGVGVHRLGIQHRLGIGAVPGWLIVGGERWSGVISKECPGDAKIAQLPGIVATAAAGPTIQEDDMTPDQAAALTEVVGNTRATNAVVGDLNVVIRDPSGGMAVQLARMSGVVAGLAVAVSQLQSGAGIDQGALNAAAQAGAQQALADLGNKLTA